MAKVVLLIAAIVEFVFRGLPAFFGCRAVADLFRLTYLEEILPYAHAFGAVMICFGVLLFIASRAPEKHALIINIGILRFTLGIAAQLLTWVMAGELGMFWVIHIIIDAILVVLLLVSRPKASGSKA